VCMTHQLGYGRWEELKYEIRKAWNFRFDWFIKARRRPARPSPAARFFSACRPLARRSVPCCLYRRTCRLDSPLHLLSRRLRSGYILVWCDWEVDFCLRAPLAGDVRVV
jgi:hypothetical protein